MDGNKDCLSSVQLEAVAEGVGSEADRTHVASCAHCQTELALFREFTAAAPSPSEASGVREIERRLRSKPAWKPKRNWWSPWLPAVALAVAIAVGVWIGNRPQERGVEQIDSGITRAVGLAGLEPVGDLGRAPESLSWQPVPGAARYSVALLDIEDQVLWETAGAAESRIAIPDPARALMAPRKTLFWRVTALDASGNVLTVSTPQRFRVTP